MQEASGADFIDLNWSAQPSANDPRTSRPHHSFSCISSTSPSQAHQADARRGMLPAIKRSMPSVGRAMRRFGVAEI